MPSKYKTFIKWRKHLLTLIREIFNKCYSAQKAIATTFLFESIDISAVLMNFDVLATYTAEHILVLDEECPSQRNI